MNQPDCLFCKIANHEVNCYKIAENKHAIAFLDINPMADGHTLIISKQHYDDLSCCPNEVIHAIFDLVKEVAVKIKKSSLKPWGFNYLSNQGAIAGQVIMHVHVHVIPKYAKNEGFEIKMGREYLSDIEKIYKKLAMK